jgi:hypothetical protein
MMAACTAVACSGAPSDDMVADETSSQTEALTLPKPDIDWTKIDFRAAWQRKCEPAEKYSTPAVYEVKTKNNKCTNVEAARGTWAARNVGKAGSKACLFTWNRKDTSSVPTVFDQDVAALEDVAKVDGEGAAAIDAQCTNNAIQALIFNDHMPGQCPDCGCPECFAVIKGHTYVVLPQEWTNRSVAVDSPTQLAVFRSPTRVFPLANPGPEFNFKRMQRL